MAYERLVRDLAGIVGRSNVLTSEEDRKVYSYDGTSTWTHKPDMVVFPTETSHVEAVRVQFDETGTSDRDTAR